MPQANRGEAPLLHSCSSGLTPAAALGFLGAHAGSIPVPISVLAPRCQHFLVPAWLPSPQSPLLRPSPYYCTDTHWDILQNKIEWKEHPEVLLGLPVHCSKQHLQNSELCLLVPAPVQCFTSCWQLQPYQLITSSQLNFNILGNIKPACL